MKQIYTGYQWRPMTEAELEIMEASRIVPAMTDEAHAGDIYEGAPEKCLYCYGGTVHNKVILSARDIIAYISDENALQIESYGDDAAENINYCPMCGRKLEETK